MKSGDKEEKIMEEVVLIEAENSGYRIAGLFGEEKFIEGRIQTLDFRDGRLVLQKTDN